MVAIERPLNDLVGLTGVLNVNFVQAALRFKNVLGVPLDIACLALETGATDRAAVYASGSGTSALSFNYTCLLYTSDAADK